MSYFSKFTYSAEDLDDAVKKDRQRLQEEIRQAIENGVIKIASGSDALFKILEEEITEHD